MNILTKKSQSYFAEFLCTSIFGYCVYSAVASSKIDSYLSSTAVGLTVGFSGIVLIYTFVDLTVAHFNPAITLAAICFNKLDVIDGLVYILMQVLGFIFAALLIILSFPENDESVLNYIQTLRVSKEVNNLNLFVVEAILTFILVFVAFSVAINSKRDSDKSLYGDEELPDRSIVAPLTIGLTLAFLAFVAPTTSGGLFNPGLAFAPSILIGDFEDVYVYIIAEFLGGIIGGFLQVFVFYK
ncbi:AQP [Hepatospora eriocheir]|uniref:Aquaporin n=1 Tax=Hepatospora eriocheir TaxID=1081669 RepID=A0A1X0QC23_9MICR|nr:AQP [Hepatospora eriocheir]